MSVYLMMLLAVITACNEEEQSATSEADTRYTMPEESEPHEGTWLQWPHHYQYGVEYRNELDPTWIAMTGALVTGEKVHIIAYDETEESRIIALLNNAQIALDNVDFYLFPTDDVWVRDNGPIYTRDLAGNLVIQNWGFNGWGEKVDEASGLPIEFENCNAIPGQIGQNQGIKVIDLNNTIINEGGSVVIDGNGTLMACKSSILNSNRNPGMTVTEAEEIFTTYLGVTHFIWLEGQAGLELTDQHIDGFAVFGNATTIVTMSPNDLLEYDVLQRDIDQLYSSTNKNGEAYTFLQVPLTQNTVKKTDGTDLGYRGSYINYYIANDKVLVPNYQDPNDAVANEIIQTLYPTRTVVGIDVRNLYENGGMVHCVTQQQPQ